MFDANVKSDLERGIREAGATEQCRRAILMGLISIDAYVKDFERTVYFEAQFNF